MLNARSYEYFTFFYTRVAETTDILVAIILKLIISFMISA